MTRTHKLKKIIHTARIIINDDQRKDLLVIVKEFLILSILSRRFVLHYFNCLLYKKSRTNYRDYLNAKEFRWVQKRVCSPDVAEILNNKLLCHKYFSDTKVKLPKLLGYNFHDKLILTEQNSTESFVISDNKQFYEVVGKMIKMSNSGAIFVKPIRGSGGKMAFKLESSFFDLPEQSRLIIRKNILLNNFIFQDLLIQHSSLERLNASSLNTVRIDTFKGGDANAPEIMSALLRVGGSFSSVDNILSGGMFVGINLENGTLKKECMQYLSSGGRTFTEHPDSKISFKGYSIPFFDNVKSMVIECADLLPKAMIGWDIPITRDGPVMLEGNVLYYGMQASDIAYGGYKSNPVYQKAVASIS